jgi:hypothetical protein
LIAQVEGVDQRNNDRQAHLSRTQELIRRKRYQEALDRFLWFDEHALEHDPGMSGVRLSATHWSFIHCSTNARTARLLRSIVRHANLKVLTKSRRGPKKPRRTPNCKNIKHLSTHRLLNQTHGKAC